MASYVRFWTASMLFLTATSAMDKVIPKGAKLFYQTSGTEFFAYGMWYATGTPYQPGYDILSDKVRCQRDVTVLKQLGINMIAVPGIDASKSHADCYNIFAAQNIFVLPVFGIGSYLNDSSALPPTGWTIEDAARVTDVADECVQNTNCFGFLVYTEAGSWRGNGDTSLLQLPYAKAAVRDLKSHLRTVNHGDMMVGFSSTQGNSVFEYMQCGVDGVPDFLALNDAAWCYAPSNFFAEYTITNTFGNFSRPAILAPYKCTTDSNNMATYTEVNATYEVAPMSNVWSGGILYQYFNSSITSGSFPAGYGVVSEVSASRVSQLPAYSNLATVLKNTNPTPTTLSAYTSFPDSSVDCEHVQQAVPPSYSSLPPSPYPPLCSCLIPSLSCRVSSGVQIGQNFTNLTSGAILSTYARETIGTASGVSVWPAGGQYGDYSMCSWSQQASYLLDHYYLSVRNVSGFGPGSCNASINGSLYQPTPPTGACKTILDQAGYDGLGTYTQLPASAFPNTTSDSAAYGDSENLSRGAIAGITVGSVVGFLLLLAAATVIYQIMRNKKRREATMGSGMAEATAWAGSNPGGGALSRNPGNVPGHEVREYYSATDGRPNMWARPMPPEVSGESSRFELDRGAGRRPAELPSPS